MNKKNTFTMKNVSFYLVTTVLVFLSFQSFSQNKDSVSNWKKAFQAGANLNQASFSDNWKGGGINSMALGLFLNAKANYEDKILSFANDLQTQYGFLRNEGQETKKNMDRLFFDSKLGYKITPKVNAFVSVNFLSQFYNGYSYPKDSLGREVPTLISKFMAPAYLTSSVGIEYKPLSYLWMRFGTGTFRQTFVVDTTLYKNEPKNYGVPVGKKYRNEVAFQFIVNFDKDIAKNINLKTNFMALADYRNLQAVDTRFDLILTAKVTKFINVNLTGTMMYDQDMDYKVQYSQMLGIGILFSYSEFPKK